MNGIARVVLTCALVMAPAAVAARRLAVVVGHNAGQGAQPPLRYAESDAGKLGRVLVELGGVAPADLWLLQGQRLAALHEALTQVRGRVAQWQRASPDRVMLLFYFSGHSDGAALELGRERLEFAELRRLLRATGADVRIAIVDTCKSGALLAYKGGTPGPAYAIRLREDLATAGEALLTSSAADEVALESRAIRGAFFTHHLVSGLRGAADYSGDGRVTLGEAYQYAYGHTIVTTGATMAGPQHPAFDYRLSGRGEVVLTELGRRRAALVMPPGFERALVVQLVRDQVLVELTAGAAPLVAVTAGRYAVQAWRAGRGYVGRVSVQAGETRAVAWSELGAAPAAAVRAKGDGETPEEEPRAAGRPGPHARLGLAVVCGVQPGVAAALGPMFATRLAVRAPGPSGLSVGLDLATGAGLGFRETGILARVGYRLGLERGRFRVAVGLEGGGGALVQSLEPRGSAVSGALSLGGWAGAALRVHGPLALLLEGHAPAVGLRRDGTLAIAFLPAAWLGLGLGL